jgi:hypothetical protein
MSDSTGPQSNDPKPDDLAAKAEKLANEALEAGKKFIETDTGRQVAEATDKAFATAEEMGRKIADSEMGKKALESDLGKQAAEFARPPFPMSWAAMWRLGRRPVPWLVFRCRLLARSWARSSAPGWAICAPSRRRSDALSLLRQ